MHSCVFGLGKAHPLCYVMLNALSRIAAAGTFAAAAAATGKSTDPPW